MPTSPLAQNASTQSKPQQKTAAPRSLFDFLTMAGSQKCVFSDSASHTSGTVYLAGGKMRGDFQSDENGTKQASHMMHEGNFVYFWIDGQPQGYKMSLSAMKANTATSGASNEQSNPFQKLNTQTKASYSCSPWSGDQAGFALPKNIKFLDFTSMMQGAVQPSSVTPGSAVQNNSASCAQCDQIPAGTARNQCRSYLKCQ